MAMNMSVEARSDYLGVLVTGVFEVQEALSLLGRVFTESIRHQQPKILIDYRGLQGIPPFMTEDFVYAASAALLVQKYVDVTGKPPRLAYLAPDSIVKDGEYAVNVAGKFGFHDVKRTTSVDEALDWLGSDDTGPAGARLQSDAEA